MVEDISKGLPLKLDLFHEKKNHYKENQQSQSHVCILKFVHSMNAYNMMKCSLIKTFYSIELSLCPLP